MLLFLIYNRIRWVFWSAAAEEERIILEATRSILGQGGQTLFCTIYIALDHVTGVANFKELSQGCWVHTAFFHIIDLLGNHMIDLIGIRRGITYHLGGRCCHIRAREMDFFVIYIRSYLTFSWVANQKQPLKEHQFYSMFGYILALIQNLFSDWITIRPNTDIINIIPR